MKFPRSQYDGPVEWSMFVFIGFAKEYSQEQTLFGQVSGFR